MSIREVIDYIDSVSKIAITFHVSPDGDATGSVLSLLQGLRKYGKEAYIISKDRPADNLGFLPYIEEITGIDILPTEGTECVIVLDCGNVERIAGDIENFAGKILNIDHHLSNDMYGFINYVDTTASSTSEIIYELLTEMGVKIDENISKTLYTGIVTDTGSFRFSNATEKTHKIAGALVGKDIKHDAIHRDLFDNKSFGKLKLIGKVLDDMELVCSGKLVVMKITKDMLSLIDTDKEDTGDLVSFGNKVSGAQGCVLLKEADDAVKISFRSKDELDVRKIAEMFGGGGHTKAAGAKISGVTIEEAKKMVIEKLEKELM
ncbi:MAG: DHH family phosphoesterase [Sarcina sp.]